MLCRGCHAPIFFAATTRDQNIPVDWEPAPNGNLSITDTEPVSTAVVLTLGQAAGMREAGIELYLTHFATCKHADEFRRKARHNSRIDAARAARKASA